MTTHQNVRKNRHSCPNEEDDTKGLGVRYQPVFVKFIQNNRPFSKREKRNVLISGSQVSITTRLRIVSRRRCHLLLITSLPGGVKGKNTGGWGKEESGGMWVRNEGGDERPSNLDRVSKLIFDHVGYIGPGTGEIR